MRHLVPLLLVVVAEPAWPADYSARVVGVADGDTITVLTTDKAQHRIRLWGIDAPEAGQAFGRRAKQAASSLAFGKTVTIRVRGTDRYGRQVAEVFLPDGCCMNREMVGQGMAWWYRKYAPHDTELARLKSEARAARSGLWMHPSPVPPWSWRQGAGVPQTAVVVGNRTSHVYHKPSRRGAAGMSAKNRVEFETAARAEAAGYRCARDCR